MRVRLSNEMIDEFVHTVKHKNKSTEKQLEYFNQLKEVFKDDHFLFLKIYLMIKEMNLRDFAYLCGIGPSNMSKIVNEKQPISKRRSVLIQAMTEGFISLPHKEKTDFEFWYNKRVDSENSIDEEE